MSNLDNILSQYYKIPINEVKYIIDYDLYSLSFDDYKIKHKSPHERYMLLYYNSNLFHVIV